MHARSSSFFCKPPRPFSLLGHMPPKMMSMDAYESLQRETAWGFLLTIFSTNVFTYLSFAFMSSSPCHHSLEHVTCNCSMCGYVSRQAMHSAGLVGSSISGLTVGGDESGQGPGLTGILSGCGRLAHFQVQSLQKLLLSFQHQWGQESMALVM